MSSSSSFCGKMGPLGNIALYKCDLRNLFMGIIGKLPHGEDGQWRIVHIHHATDGSRDLTHMARFAVCPENTSIQGFGSLQIPVE